MIYFLSFFQIKTPNLKHLQAAALLDFQFVFGDSRLGEGVGRGGLRFEQFVSKLTWGNLISFFLLTYDRITAPSPPHGDHLGSCFTMTEGTELREWGKTVYGLPTFSMICTELSVTNSNESEWSR